MIDLHVHSNHSDGTLSPEDLVTLAVNIGLSAFALTDHDTVSGIAAAKKAAEQYSAKGSSVTVIPGIEISAAYEDRDIHILGLFIDEASDALSSVLEKAVYAREQRNEQMTERFQNLGIGLTLDALRTQNPDTVITRAHFAKFLIEHHYVKTQAEAFERYLGYHSPCFVPREYMAPEAAISAILQAGGIPVLAHPLLYRLKPNVLDSLIERLKSAGLKGLEVFYSSNTSFDESIVYSLANRHNLLMTGGSDFHGSNKPNLFLGTGRNQNLNIPDRILEPLYHYLNTKS